MGVTVQTASADSADHSFLAEHVFPTVPVQRGSIEYPRGPWRNPEPVSPLRRLFITTRGGARHARRVVAEWVAGDQWPSTDDGWD